MAGGETQNERQRPREAQVDLGVFAKRPSRGLSAAEVIAATLSLLWLIGAVVFFGVLGGAEPDTGGALRFIMVLLAVVLPIAVIWVAAVAARSARIMRAESDQLQAAMSTMRQAFVETQHAHGLGPRALNVEKKLDEIAQAQKQTESALATFVSARPGMARALEAPAPLRDVTPPRDDADGQAVLELGTPPEALTPPVELGDLIRAVNFPENAEDAEGFAALRRALTDRKVASLIQAAQDILTLLSQDGIYMDDLKPDRARPEVWRRFARGERGRAVAVLGGVRDRSSLALTAGRMKQDAVFRDAAHHFLRRFDDVLAEVEPKASDEELVHLCDSRTARAFMLLGRVTGTFD